MMRHLRNVVPHIASDGEMRDCSARQLTAIPRVLGITEAGLVAQHAHTRCGDRLHARTIAGVPKAVHAASR